MPDTAKRVPIEQASDDQLLNLCAELHPGWRVHDAEQLRYGRLQGVGSFVWACPLKSLDDAVALAEAVGVEWMVTLDGGRLGKYRADAWPDGEQWSRPTHADTPALALTLATLKAKGFTHITVDAEVEA